MRWLLSLLLFQWEWKESRNKHPSSAVQQFSGHFICYECTRRMSDSCTSFFISSVKDGHDEDVFIAQKYRSFIALIYLIPCVSLLWWWNLCDLSFIHLPILHVIDFCPLCHIFVFGHHIYDCSVSILNWLWPSMHLVHSMYTFLILISICGWYVRSAPAQSLAIFFQFLSFYLFSPVTR